MIDLQGEAPAQHDDIDGVRSPAETDAVVGHEGARAALSEAAESGRLHHAWLLHGPRGIGKASAAFDFARRLLAASGEDQLADDVPDDLARQVAQGAHPGLVHIARPAGERGGFRTQITVEEIRRLNHFFHTTAGRGWRIAIVDPADDMNRNAANALLKILEEPPDRSLFLIINHQPGRLLPTIRSRCRSLRFEALSPVEIGAALEAGAIGTNAAERARAGERADGSVRTACLMLLGGGLELEDALRTLYSGEPDWSAIQKLADALTMKGREAAFDLAAARLLALLADEAEEALGAGSRGRAASLAAFWQAEQARWREAAAFNLDRKQVLLTFFHGLRNAREAARPDRQRAGAH